MCSAFTPDCGYDRSTINLIGDVLCPNTECSGKLCLHKKTFQSLGRSDYQCPQCTSVCQVLNIPSEDQTKSFFLSFGQVVYIFEETLKSNQDVVGDVYCPSKYCFNREKCEFLDGFVTTRRLIYCSWKNGAWLFVHQILFMLQEHVKTTKTNRMRFFFARKRWTWYPTINYYLLSHFNQPNIDRKNCVWTTKYKTIRDVFCPICRNEKCVYVSAIKTTSSYDCTKCKACCKVLNIPFKDQKRTIMLFGGDSTYCFARKTSRDYEQEKPSPFLKRFLRQSQSRTSEPEPKKLRMSPNLEKTYPFPTDWWFERHIHFSNHLIQFQSTVSRSNLINQLTENHNLLSLQRRNPMDSRV